MIGKTLSHFRILAKLGEGGMGVVYRAEDTSLRRPVALKVLPPELVANEERRLRFLREARAAAAVTHPNIATVYEVGEAPADSSGGSGIVFIAMELVEGRTLREMIGERSQRSRETAGEAPGGRPMSIKDAVRIASEIAEGLARAHQSKVIHRDLKPENIVVGEDGHPKILDFGLAKLVQEARQADPDLSKLATISEDMTREGRVFGTAAYMSPEQARGETADARSDIFSFGTTLYEAVTGKTPFRGKSAAELLSAILRDEPAPASSLNAEVPQELDRLLLKCLEKDRADRYQDCRDLLVDLRRLRRVTDSGVQAARTPAAGVSKTPPPAGWLRGGWSAPTLLGGGAVAACLLVAVLFLLDVGGLRGRLTGGAGAEPIESLAVLPLANLSGDPEQEYFADGMTDELITRLGRISALKVISRQSVMRYKGADKPLPEIAGELGVDAVVQGSVLRAGDRVRITAQLVEAVTDRHLWAESYERDLKDVLALQSEIAMSIAREIEVTLTPQEEARPAVARAAEPTVNPEAYEAYLKGRHHWYKRTREGLKKGLEFFQQAIEKDPTYAPAHAGLADAYQMLVFYGHLPQKEGIPRARQAALKSLELDERLAEGHTALAQILADYDWDWVKAEVEFRRALELNPNYPLTHMWYAGLLQTLNRGEESLAEQRRAQELDPLSPLSNASLAEKYYVSRRYNEAIEQARKTLEIEPDFFYTHWVLGVAHFQQGRLDEAIAELEKAEDLSGGANWIVESLGHAYAVTGRTDAARQRLTRLLEADERGIVSAYSIALVHAGLGENEEAFRWLEKAYREREGSLKGLNYDPLWDSLRKDPRFRDLLRRMGLPAESGVR